VAQKSLKAQIVKYGIVSLASAGVFISGAYLLNRYLTVRQAVDYEGNKLVASARKQAEEILPGLLVPEEYGSIDLQLKKSGRRKTSSMPHSINPRMLLSRSC